MWAEGLSKSIYPQLTTPQMTGLSLKVYKLLLKINSPMENIYLALYLRKHIVAVFSDIWSMYLKFFDSRHKAFQKTPKRCCWPDLVWNDDTPICLWFEVYWGFLTTKPHTFNKEDQVVIYRDTVYKCKMWNTRLLSQCWREEVCV